MFSFLSFEGFSIWDLVEAEFSVQCQVVKQMNGGGGILQQCPRWKRSVMKRLLVQSGEALSCSWWEGAESFS